MDDDALAAALPGMLDRVWSMPRAAVSPLGGGMNSATALVETGQGTSSARWVAKWVPAGGAAGLLAGAELARRLELAGVACGAPVPTRRGELVSSLDGGSVVLLRFVPGRELTGRGEDQPLLARTLARAHAGLGTRRQRGALFAGLGSDPRAAEVGSWIRPSISAIVRQYQSLPALTWGVLHADPAPEAFRLDEATGAVGLIDWAGASEGPLLYDVASALMYLGGLEAGRSFLDSYTEAGPVPAVEIEQHLLILRRFRAAVQADYFAGRVLSDDRTGIADPSENLEGLADAYAMLTDLGALETGDANPPGSTRSPAPDMPNAAGDTGADHAEPGGATMISGIDHVQLAMPRGGEEAARTFYGELLGMSEVAKPPALAARGGCWFRSGSAVLHLGVEEPYVPARKAHPALLVDDLDALHDRVAAAGYECVRADGDIPGVRRFHTFDVFGNRIEFQQG